MDTEPFSAAEFQGTNSPEAARILADKLQEAVLRELEPIIGQAFSKVIAELNSSGHYLSPYGPHSPGEYVFRDEPSQGTCRLRLACDVVISAGYVDTFSEKD